MNKKLKVGDIVKIEWSSNSDCFRCPICGKDQFCPGYCDTTYCENCDSEFEEVPCIRILKVGEVKHDVYNKVELVGK